MAQGEYKNGVAIEVQYQAVNSATGKTVTMDVYDETHTKDVPKCIAAMTEIGTTGRYYATFTPDAEGIWTVLTYNTTDSNGPVMKQYAVAGHNIDSIGDSIATIDGKVDDVKTQTDKLQFDSNGNVLADANVADALAIYDVPTKAEMDAGFAAIGSPAIMC